MDESRNQTTPLSRSCVSQTKGNIGKSDGPSIGLLVFPSVGPFVRLSIRQKKKKNEPASQYFISSLTRSVAVFARPSVYPSIIVISQSFSESVSKLIPVFTSLTKTVLDLTWVLFEQTTAVALKWH